MAGKDFTILRRNSLILYGKISVTVKLIADSCRCAEDEDDFRFRPAFDTMVRLRLLLLLPFLVSSSVAFTPSFCIREPLCGENYHHTASTKSIETTPDEDGEITSVANTVQTKYDTTLSSDRSANLEQIQQSRLARLRTIFRRRDAHSDNKEAIRQCRFTYNYEELIIGDDPDANTTAVMLVHPIGVGIGRWYYTRLLHQLNEGYGDANHRLAFISPDLLGSATASCPITECGTALKKMPLLNITDWTDQVAHLMAEYEGKSKSDGHAVDRWAIVANGGCSPIALQVAALSVDKNSRFNSSLTNVIISSAPRLPFFLDSTDPGKVRKSYRTLSGIAGRLFWWYSLRKGGRFIQKFSERNLVGDPASLGEEWTPNAVAAARLNDGLSRYSTFAFLAGTLQDGCSDSLNALKGSGVTIDFIRGTDKRRNRAKSWFWTRKNKSNQGRDDKGDLDTVQKYVRKNGNRGKELLIGGRISLAWEDSAGYAKSLMELLCA